jgi:hypothetical protein
MRAFTRPCSGWPVVRASVDHLKPKRANIPDALDARCHTTLHPLVREMPGDEFRRVFADMLLY